MSEEESGASNKKYNINESHEHHQGSKIIDGPGITRALYFISRTHRITNKIIKTNGK